MRWLLCVVTLVLGVTADDMPWWKTAIFYQVYPRSFQDSDGDGVGDLKGIAQKADYFKEIGVDAIWLSPIYESPMADFGYDISNYTRIDPTFGTMDDFDALVTKLRSIDVKLVLDFVPNHSSDEHVWFKKSVNREPGYEDFYVWKDGKNNGSAQGPPPNNWLSIFSGSAWEWNEQRGQYYYHQFVVKQPDLNYVDPNVQSNMTAVIEFWLDKGVDGFRMDAVKYMFENASYPDEPIISGDGSTYNDLDHGFETDQPETLVLLRKWADLVYQRVQSDNRPRAIFLEVYDPLNVTMEYFGKGTESLEFPFNFNLLGGTEATRPSDFKQLIESWMDLMPAGGVANWVVGNHDNHRVATTYGPEMADSINLLTGVLPGIKVTYYGEEIAMEDTFIRWDQSVDPSGLLLGPDHYLEGTRDPERTPMQWDDSVSAGFSSNSTTWLPANPNYWWLNVAAQKSADHSHLKVFQAMAQARKDPILISGDLKVIVPDNDTLVVIRSLNQTNCFALIMNMGSEVKSYTNDFFATNVIDADMHVVVGSISSAYQTGSKLAKGSLSVSLTPKAALLLRTGSSTPSSASQLMSSLFLLCSMLFFVLRR